MEQQTENTFSWKCRKHCKAITFSGISFNVLNLMETNMAGVRKGMVAEEQEEVGRSLTPGRSAYTLHYISANTMWDLLKYFLHTITSRFCGEIHLNHALNPRQFQSFI